MPMISLIVPVYNDKEYLEKSIGSFINQSFSNYEVILVDDGSNDGSDAILDEYQSQCEKLRVIHKKNGGASSARNVGIDNAKGDWIIFADSDDVVSHTYIEDLYNRVDGCDFGWHGETKLYNNGVNVTSTVGKGRIFDMSSPNEVSDMMALAWRTNFPGPCCKIYKKEIFDKYHIRMNEDMIFGEDFECLLRYLGKCKSVKAIEGCGNNYLYYQNSDSITYRSGTFEQEFTSLKRLHTEIDNFIKSMGVKGSVQMFNATLQSGRNRVMRSLFAESNRYTKAERIKNYKRLRIDKSIGSMFFTKKSKASMLIDTLCSLNLWTVVDRMVAKGLLG